MCPLSGRLSSFFSGQDTLASTDGFGKYGVIRESDMYRYAPPSVSKRTCCVSGADKEILNMLSSACIITCL